MTYAQTMAMEAGRSTSNPGAAHQILQFSGVLWFFAAAIGQWVFVYYVAAYFTPVLANRGLPGLEETHLPSGYVPGDLAGNLAIAAHVLIAVIIIGGGPLQLIPAIRNRFPAFHRYLGRTYMVLAVITSIAGLYLVWTRGVPGGPLAPYAISLDAILIILFAAIAVRYAMMRRFDKHRRWAMRLFMVVSAVWFFRIGLMFWFMTTGGLGINVETFTGPALTTIYFAQMFIPLAILQLYFSAQDSGQIWLKTVSALIVLGATAVTAAGTFAATVGMWLPRL